MREKIAGLVKEIRYRPEYSDKQSWQFADQILILIREEVGKVENNFRIPMCTYAFENCRQAILAIFKED